MFSVMVVECVMVVVFEVCEDMCEVFFLSIFSGLALKKKKKMN